VTAVETDRLCDDLSDGAGLRRQGRRCGLPLRPCSLAGHACEPTLYRLTRVIRVATTPAHRQAKRKNRTRVKRDRHESPTRASVRE
jgi:hypothetical protein